jgi:30S ribosomal protein S31
MGKGDKRSRRGKIFKNSYGNKRPHKIKAPVFVKPQAAAAPLKIAKK